MVGRWDIVLHRTVHVAECDSATSIVNYVRAFTCLVSAEFVGGRATVTKWW